VYTKCISIKTKMTDLFDNTILCRECNIRMNRINVEKNGFSLRALQCPKCNNRVYHPIDIDEYKKFSELKNKVFKVKLRIVGNSYAVSIPKEIVEFIHEQERLMNDMVRLCFEESGRLSLLFDNKQKIFRKNG